MSLASIELKSSLALGALEAKTTGALNNMVKDNILKRFARRRILRPIKGVNIITGSSGFKITGHSRGLTSGLWPMVSIIKQVAQRHRGREVEPVKLDYRSIRNHVGNQQKLSCF